MMLSHANLDDQSTRTTPALTEPYRYLPALVDAAYSNGFLCSLDADGVIRYASENVATILGISRADIVGHSFDEFLSDSSDNDRVRDKCWTSIVKDTVTKCSCELISQDQEPLTVELKCLGVFQNGEVVGLVAYIQLRARAGQDVGDQEEQKLEDRARVKKLVSQLSNAEREVVELVVEGHMNKSMAKMLGVAVRTIEARRSRAMSKLQVRSLPDLVKTWLLFKDN